MVLKSVSRKVRSRARRWTTVCNPSGSRRRMRSSTRSRKLDLGAAMITARAKSPPGSRRSHRVQVDAFGRRASAARRGAPSRTRSGSEPFLSLKPGTGEERGDKHDGDGEFIAKAHLQFGHVFEVHAVPGAHDHQ